MLTKAEAAEVRSVLLAWRADGVARPILPTYGEDGAPVFYGLDENGQVAVVPDGKLPESVSVSNGTGLEQGGDD
jgi:hypothetical protein